MNLDRGYITVASGQRRFLEFATDLALSVREYNPEPIALILGDELRPFATPAHLAPFARVIPLPDGFPQYLGKLAAPAHTPFARTLYIDADCLVIADFADLWRRLAPESFAMQGKYHGAGEDIAHHSFAVADLIARFGIERYLKSNSGLLYFRKEEGIAIAESCMRLRRDGFDGRMTCDELLFGIVADAMGISAISRPWPMPWWPHVVEPHDRAYRLVHFIGPMPLATMTWLFEGVRRRREAAGLPPNDSIVLWLNKTLGRDGRAKDSATRFGLWPDANSHEDGPHAPDRVG